LRFGASRTIDYIQNTAAASASRHTRYHPSGSPRILGSGERGHMAKPINTSSRPLTDEVLHQLAELGRVPDAGRKFFFESVYQIVQTACDLDGLVKQGLTSKRGKKLAGAALALYDGLGNLNKHERALIEGILGGKAKFIFDRISSGGLVGLEETAYQLALLSSLITGKPHPRLPSQPPDPPVAGRRSGTVEHWAFQNFVYDLLISTKVANGRLTLAKSNRTGSLIKAIIDLTPYLPDHFVPEPLPISTLQKIRVAFSRVEKEVPDEDAS